MARLAARQVAGYFPTPSELLPSIASLVEWSPEDTTYHSLSILDPCAGDGQAVDGLRSQWCLGLRVREGQIRVIAGELEGERARALAASRGLWDKAFHSDAFHLHWAPGRAKASCLFLNPPYDSDAGSGRLEHRFLVRFTEALHPGRGVLLYLVPYPVLGVSASFLVRHYLDLRAWRLPEPHFSTYRQVLVLARRSPEAVPAGGLPSASDDRLSAWATEPESLPVLPEHCPSPLTVSFDFRTEFPLEIRRRGVDLTAAIGAWRPFEGQPTGTDLEASAILGRRHQTAMPPRPAHIALALSSGMFNGRRLEPNDPLRHPPILAKGVFERDLALVGEKVNGDGEVTGLVHIEHPRLRLTILRLDTYRYIELDPGVLPEGGDDPERWNAADLIANYDRSLAAHLSEQFPAIHDPAEPAAKIKLPSLARTPYRIQAEAIQAALKLLALGRTPLLDAEVGTGKTTMALFIAAALRPPYREATLREIRRLGLPSDGLPTVRQTLVLCPPHLLESWSNEIEAVLPGSRVKVLSGISDLEAEADFYLLSRETAKLGHRVEGLSGRCPRCGEPIRTTKASNASRRRRCPALEIRPLNAAAKLALELAALLAPVLPEEPLVGRYVRHRVLRKRLERPAGELREGSLRLFLGRLLAELRPTNPEALAPIAFALETLAPLLAEEASVARRLLELLEDCDLPSYLLRSTATRLQSRSARPGDPARKLLRHLEAFLACADWSKGEPCDEPLYQAIPSPRRFPLARVIQTRHRRRFDLLVIDEAHEFSHLRSAQTHAAHRLMGLPGTPTIALTGSLMNGYASSLFANFWALSRPFREEFRRSDLRLFSQRYGYRKVLVRPEDEAKRKREFGSTSDRELGRTQDLGEAPGVMPTFLMRHLLPTTIVVHKEDLDEELPPKDERPVAIEAGEDPRDVELLDEYRRLERRLLDQIRRDRFDPELSGMLLGTLLELPSYLDRSTEDQGEFRVAYPAKVGGETIAVAKRFPNAYVSPKERWLLGELRSRIDEGEKVIVFLRHTGTPALPRRLLRLIEAEVTASCLWLDAKKVPAARRESWINQHVIKPGVKVLLINPDAVRTGLRNPDAVLEEELLPAEPSA